MLGAYAALRVRDGALEIEHGPHDDRQTIRIDIDSEPKPHTILFDSHGEFLTGEAIRWCARYSINLVLPGGPGRLITMVESALETKTNTMTRMRAIDPMIIRAQCAADPVKVAREIVRAKIEAGLKLTMTDADARLRAAQEWEAKLQTARCVAEIMVVEGRAAAAYWRCFQDAGLRERKNGNLPRSWMRSAQRGKGNAFFGPKNAAHPINAMLNYCYVVEAGRLATALAAQGLALPIGYLHSDKKGRNSLVWDAIEPLRPSIDAKVFAFVEAHEFARRDFPQSGYNVHRLGSGRRRGGFGVVFAVRDRRRVYFFKQTLAFGGEMWQWETRAMIDSATLSIFIIPAIGLLFAVGLFVVAAIPDRRDLRRAAQLERKAGA